MVFFRTAAELMPERFFSPVLSYEQKNIEEIRLRLDQAPQLISQGNEWELTGEKLNIKDLERTLEKATGASVHSSVHQLKEGYTFYRGLRIGICGRGIIKSNSLSGFSKISSMNIRIPGRYKGEIDPIYNFTSKPSFQNTLIISPPGMGKTTLLRELITKLSDRALRIGVVDERGELEAADMDTAGFFLGKRSDVLSGIKKSQAAMMLLRGMNPQVIALDEITSAEDIDCIFEIVGCGVGILATAHSWNVPELSKRELYRRLLSEKVFKKAIEIHIENGRRTYNCVRL